MDEPHEDSGTFLRYLVQEKCFVRVHLRRKSGSKSKKAKNKKFVKKKKSDVCASSVEEHVPDNTGLTHEDSPASIKLDIKTSAEVTTDVSDITGTSHRDSASTAQHQQSHKTPLSDDVEANSNSINKKHKRTPSTKQTQQKTESSANVTTHVKNFRRNYQKSLSVESGTKILSGETKAETTPKTDIAGRNFRKASADDTKTTGLIPSDSCDQQREKRVSSQTRKTEVVERFQMKSQEGGSNSASVSCTDSVLYAKYSLETANKETKDKPHKSHSETKSFSEKRKKQTKTGEKSKRKNSCDISGHVYADNSVSVTETKDVRRREKECEQSSSVDQETQNIAGKTSLNNVSNSTGATSQAVPNSTCTSMTSQPVHHCECISEGSENVQILHNQHQKSSDGLKSKSVEKKTNSKFTQQFSGGGTRLRKASGDHTTTEHVVIQTGDLEIQQQNTDVKVSKRMSTDLLESSNEQPSPQTEHLPDTSVKNQSEKSVCDDTKAKYVFRKKNAVSHQTSSRSGTKTSTDNVETRNMDTITDLSVIESNVAKDVHNEHLDTALRSDHRMDDNVSNTASMCHASPDKRLSHPEEHDGKTNEQKLASKSITPKRDTSDGETNARTKQIDSPTKYSDRNARFKKQDSGTQSSVSSELSKERDLHREISYSPRQNSDKSVIARERDLLKKKYIQNVNSKERDGQRWLSQGRSCDLRDLLIDKDRQRRNWDLRDLLKERERERRKSDSRGVSKERDFERRNNDLSVSKERDREYTKSDLSGVSKERAHERRKSDSSHVYKDIYTRMENSDSPRKHINKNVGFSEGGSQRCEGDENAISTTKERRPQRNTELTVVSRERDCQRHARDQKYKHSKGLKDNRKDAQRVKNDSEFVSQKRVSERESTYKRTMASRRKSDLCVMSKDRESPKTHFVSEEEDTQKVNTDKKIISDKKDCQREDRERKSVAAKRNVQGGNGHTKVNPREGGSQREPDNREFFAGKGNTQRESNNGKALLKEGDTQRESADDREALPEGDRDVDRKVLLAEEGSRESGDDREVIPKERDIQRKFCDGEILPKDSVQRQSDNRNLMSEKTNSSMRDHIRNISCKKRDSKSEGTDMKQSSLCRSKRNEEDISGFQIVDKSELCTTPKQDSMQEKGPLLERSGQPFKFDMKEIKSSQKQNSDIQISVINAEKDLKSPLQNGSSTPVENMLEEPMFQVCRRLNLETSGHSSNHIKISSADCENESLEHHTHNFNPGQRQSDQHEISVRESLKFEGNSFKTGACKEPLPETSSKLVPQELNNSGDRVAQNHKTHNGSNCHRKKEHHKRLSSSGHVKKRRPSKLKLFLKILVTATNRVLSSADMRNTTKTQDSMSRKRSLDIQEGGVRSLEFCNETTQSGSPSTCSENIQEEKVCHTSKDNSFEVCVETTLSNSTGTLLEFCNETGQISVPRTCSDNMREEKLSQTPKDNLFQACVETTLANTKVNIVNKKIPEISQDSSHEGGIVTRFTKINTSSGYLQKRETLEDSVDSSFEKHDEHKVTCSSTISSRNVQKEKLQKLPKDSLFEETIDNKLTRTRDASLGNLHEEKISEISQNGPLKENIETASAGDSSLHLGNLQEKKVLEVPKGSSYEESVKNIFKEASTLCSDNLQEEKLCKVSSESCFEGIAETGLTGSLGICSGNLQEEKMPATLRDRSLEEHVESRLSCSLSPCSVNVQEKILSDSFCQYSGNLQEKKMLENIDAGLNVNNGNVQKGNIPSVFRDSLFQHKQVAKRQNVFRIEDGYDQPLDLTMKKHNNSVGLRKVNVMSSTVQPLTKPPKDNVILQDNNESLISVFEENNMNQYEWISSEDNSQSSQSDSRAGCNSFLKDVQNSTEGFLHGSHGFGYTEGTISTESRDIMSMIRSRLQPVDIQTDIKDSKFTCENESQNYRESFEWISEEGSQDRSYIEEPSNAKTLVSDVNIKPPLLDPNSSYEWISDEDNDDALPLLSEEEEYEMKKRFDWKSEDVAPRSRRPNESELRFSSVGKSKQNCDDAEVESGCVSDKSDLEKPAQEKEAMNIITNSNEITMSDSDSDEDLPSFLYKDNDGSAKANLQELPDDACYEDHVSSVSLCNGIQKLHKDSALQTCSEIQSTVSVMIPSDDVLKENIKSEPKEDELDVKNIKTEPHDDVESSAVKNFRYEDESTSNTTFKTDEPLDENDPGIASGGDSIFTSSLVSNIKLENTTVESYFEQQLSETRDADQEKSAETLHSVLSSTFDDSKTREELLNEGEMTTIDINNISSEETVTGPSSSERDLTTGQSKCYHTDQGTSIYTCSNDKSEIYAPSRTQIQNESKCLCNDQYAPDSKHQHEHKVSPSFSPEKTNSSRNGNGKTQAVGADYNKGNNAKQASTKSSKQVSMTVKTSKQRKTSHCRTDSCLKDETANLDATSVIDGTRNREHSPDYVDAMVSGSTTSEFIECVTEAQSADTVLNQTIISTCDSADSSSNSNESEVNLSVVDNHEQNCEGSESGCAIDENDSEETSVEKEPSNAIKKTRDSEIMTSDSDSDEDLPTFLYRDNKESVNGKGKSNTHCATKSTKHDSVVVSTSKWKKNSQCGSVSNVTDDSISVCVDFSVSESESHSGASTFKAQTSEGQSTDSASESVSSETRISSNRGFGDPCLPLGSSGNCDIDQIVMAGRSPVSSSKKLDTSRHFSLAKTSNSVTGAGSKKESYCCDESEISRTCSCCSKILPSQYALSHHMRIHGDRPYKCIVCEKDFYCNNNLKKHMLVHIGGKLSKCNICNKTFFRQHSLNIHMLKHSMAENNEFAGREEVTSGKEECVSNGSDGSTTVSHKFPNPQDKFSMTVVPSEDVSPVVKSGDVRSCTVSSTHEADSTTGTTKSERVSEVLTRTKGTTASESQSREPSDSMSEPTHPSDSLIKAPSRHCSGPSTVMSSSLDNLPHSATSAVSISVMTEDFKTCSESVETVQNPIAISKHVKSDDKNRLEVFDIGSQSDEESCSNCEDCIIDSCEMKLQAIAKHTVSESVTAEFPKDHFGEIGTTNIDNVSLDAPQGTSKTSNSIDKPERKKPSGDESKSSIDPHQKAFIITESTVCDSSENVSTSLNSEIPSEDHDYILNISHDDSTDSSVTLIADSTHTLGIGEATKVGKIHKCNVCKKTFKKLSALTKHVTLHGVKKNKCEVCCKDFHSVAHLRQHMNVHTGNRVKCEICQKLLSSPAKLKYHMSIHTGKRRHKCTHCAECFTLGSELTAHLVTHLDCSNSGTTGDVQDSSAIKMESDDIDATSVLGKSVVNEEGTKHNPSIKEEITQTERFQVTLPSNDSEQDDLALSDILSDGLLEITNKDLREQEFIVETEILSDKLTQKANKELKDKSLNLNRASESNSRVKTNVKKTSVYKSKTNPTTAVPKVDSLVSNKSYTCNTCGKVFSSVNAKSHHMKIHNERTYKCEICGKAFYSTSNLSQHMIVHTGGNPAKCGICQKTLSCASKMKVHMRTHTNEKPYKCSVCGKCFTVWSSLKSHRIMHSNMLINCNICGKMFRHPTALERHMRAHGERKFKCEFCGKPFKRLAHLKKHQTTQHADQNDHKCYICAAVFPEGQALQQHLSIHTDFECDVCAQHFPSLEHLREHMRTHPGYKQFKCDICDKSFSQEGTFMTHKRIHTGERPYSCLICAKSFTQPTHLNTHHKVHTEKTLECENCDDKFLGIKELQRHMKIHSANKTFECKICKCRFFSERSLKRHNKDFCKKTVKPFQCDQCECRFTAKGNLRRHKRQHALKGVFPCDLCTKIFPVLNKLKTHKKIIHGVSGFSCLLCDTIFQTSELYDSHLNEHKTDNGFHCPKCKDVIPALKDLKSHMKEHLKQGHAEPNKISKTDSSTLVDQKTKKFSCDDFIVNEPESSRDEIVNTCTSVTSNIDRRSSQGGSEHSYKCKECGKGYSKENSLQRHVSKHHDKTDYGKPVSPRRRKDVNDSPSKGTNSKPDSKMTMKDPYFKNMFSDKISPEKNFDNDKQNNTKEKTSVKTCQKIQTDKLKLVNMEGEQAVYTSKSSHGIEAEKIPASTSPPKIVHKQTLSPSKSKGSHADDKLHSCQVCMKACANSDHLKRHHKKHKKSLMTSHEKGLGKTSMVERTDIEQALDISRLSQDDGILPVLSHSEQVQNKSKSPLCSETQNSSSPLEGETKTFKCKVCKKCFVDSDHLRKHMEKHSTAREEKWQNESSDESSFDKECSLPIRHQSNKADSTMPSSSTCIADAMVIFMCVVCKKGCRDSDHLTSHMKKHLTSVNSGERQHNKSSKLEKQETETAVSPKTHFAKGNVEDGIRQISSMSKSVANGADELPSTSKERATVKKPFRCELCEKSYSDFVHFERHNKKHKAKGDSCETLKDIKKKHRETEKHEESAAKKLKEENKLSHRPLQEEKKFSCNVCNKNYSDPGLLRHHMGKHSDDSKKCEQCGKTFAGESYLRQHQKKHHNEHLNEIRANQSDTVKKKYHCDICDKAFTSKSSLKEHTLIHTGEKPYKCDICPSVFGDRGSLVAHQKRHTGVRSHHCEICTKKFYETTALRAHMRVHSGELPFNCPVCGKRCSEKGHLQRHMKRHTGYKPHKCDVCDRAFAEMSTMNLHRMTHESDRPYKCEECGKGFITRQRLTTHMKIHTGECPFKCEICGKAFKAKTYLTSHLLRHGNERNFKCELCQAAFKTSDDLYHHQKIHKGKKDFECGICGKSFLTSFRLKVHITRHSDDKPFKCEQCDSRFKVKENLIKHQVIHTERSRKFICEICNEGFFSQQNLKSHKRTHSESGSYKCTVCGVFLRSSDSLRIHMRIHNNELPYTCKTCGKNFRQISNLRTHMISHSDVKQFKCTVCGKEYSLPHTLKMHMKIHSGEKRKVYECPICNKKLLRSLNSHLRTHSEKRFRCSLCEATFTRADSVRQHMIVHTRERAFQCDICKKRFTQKSALVTHKRFHTGERPYKCMICGKSFTQSSHLKTHEKGVHLQIRSHKCQICGKSFMSRPYLQQHMRVHTGEKPFQCQICKKTFAFSHSLRSHMLLHTGVKKYKCEVCERAFTHSSTLKGHMRCHTGEKPYACDQCDAAFARNDCLKNHKLSHTGVAPKCVECGKKFRLSKTLKAHMLTHNPERLKHKCEYCGKGFAQKSNLKQHMKLQHEEDEIDEEEENGAEEIHKEDSQEEDNDEDKMDKEEEDSEEEEGAEEIFEDDYEEDEEEMEIEEDAEKDNSEYSEESNNGQKSGICN